MAKTAAKVIEYVFKCWSNDLPDKLEYLSALFTQWENEIRQDQEAKTKKEHGIVTDDAMSDAARKAFDSVKDCD